MDDFMAKRWRAQPNDLLGGWCVTLDDDLRTPAEGATTIADFCRWEIAKHIAEMHNEWMDWN